jgi:hypothetical protein
VRLIRVGEGGERLVGIERIESLESGEDEAEAAAGAAATTAAGDVAPDTPH